MTYARVIIFFLIVTSLFHQNVSSSDHEVKGAIKKASDTAFWGWAKARGVPTVVGAALCVVPPVAGMLGYGIFLGNAGTGRSDDPKLGAALIIGAVGALLSPILIPIGLLIIARQSFLIERDMGLYHKFTKSTAVFNEASLPPANEIAKMTNHNQLLSAAKLYFDKEGNWFEHNQNFLSTPGLMGYKLISVAKFV